MNIDIQRQTQQDDKPLTREDVEILLQKAESPDKLSLRGRNLDNINLAYFSLPSADLRETTLINADLADAILRGADLTDAILREATLINADLRGADLRGADLRSATLEEAKLARATLRDATLINADLTNANLRGADLTRAYLTGAYLTGADLTGADLRGARLREVTLINANLTRANLTGADLTGAYLTGAIGLKEHTEEDNAPFRIRIIEEPLTPQNLTSILSAITELATKCWLIGKGRFTDVIQYTQTHDVRFVEEAQLTITRIRHNSPFEGTFNIDVSVKNIAEAIGTAIDGVVQTKVRLEQAELEVKEKAQAIELAKQKADQESKAAQLEQEKQELAVERERLKILEMRLDIQKKAIEYALEIASKTVNILQPNADEQTKGMLVQTLLPNLLQMNNGKGLELVLPPPQPQSNEQKKEG